MFFKKSNKKSKIYRNFKFNKKYFNRGYEDLPATYVARKSVDSLLRHERLIYIPFICLLQTWAWKLVIIYKYTYMFSNLSNGIFILYVKLSPMHFLLTLS